MTVAGSGLNLGGNSAETHISFSLPASSSSPEPPSHAFFLEDVLAPNFNPAQTMLFVMRSALSLPTRWVLIPARLWVAVTEAEKSVQNALPTYMHCDVHRCWPNWDAELILGPPDHP